MIPWINKVSILFYSIKEGLTEGEHERKGLRTRINRQGSQEDRERERAQGGDRKPNGIEQCRKTELARA